MLSRLREGKVEGQATCNPALYHSALLRRILFLMAVVYISLERTVNAVCVFVMLTKIHVVFVVSYQLKGRHACHIAFLCCLGTCLIK